MNRTTVVSDAAIDRLIPIVQRSNARAAVLRDRRVEIQIDDDGSIVAHITGAGR